MTPHGARGSAALAPQSILRRTRHELRLTGRQSGPLLVSDTGRPTVPTVSVDEWSGRRTAASDGCKKLLAAHKTTPNAQLLPLTPFSSHKETESAAVFPSDKE